MRRDLDSFSRHGKAVQADGTGVRMFEARDEPKQRGFTGAGRANDGGGPAAGDREVHSFKDSLGTEILGDLGNVQV
jgi:hypothetical protein